MNEYQMYLNVRAKLSDSEFFDKIENLAFRSRLLWSKKPRAVCSKIIQSRFYRISKFSRQLAKQCRYELKHGLI